MKLSFYNHITNYGGLYLLYNANSDASIMLKEKKYHLLNKYKEQIDNLKNEDNEFYELLKSNGYIVQSDYNEVKDYLLARQIKRFSTEFYHVILNSTMDCNLSCWYCYESHINNSEISEEIMDRFKKHLVLKFENQPFRELKLSFFGGEPLLAFDRVIDLIDFAKELSKSKDFKLTIDFTTNGTMINDELISALKDCDSDFQITLDGNQQKHDKVRYTKEDKLGTYDTIVANIIKLVANLDKLIVRIRINYDLKTLNVFYSPLLRPPDTLS